MIKKFIGFLFDIWKERKTILELAKNDFRAKYTNSILGIVWAFAVPFSTILIMWFVFEFGFRSAPVDDVPFILFYIPAFLAWNYFSDAFSSASGCLWEYSYMIKKMRFRVSVLPIVKLISAGFVHLFFICIIFIMFGLYGYKISIYNFQVFYYFFALDVLLIGLTWLCSALAVFSKDIGNMISVILQVGFWATPIVWVPNNLPENVSIILKCNPMYYICNGYRESFIYHKWFWESKAEFIYFWVITAIVFIIGANMFRRLRPQFADVM